MLSESCFSKLGPVIATNLKTCSSNWDHYLPHQKNWGNKKNPTKNLWNHPSYILLDVEPQEGFLRFNHYFRMSTPDLQKVSIFGKLIKLPVRTPSSDNLCFQNAFQVEAQ